MKDKQIIKVLKVVQEAPAHSLDVARETGLSAKHASAYLSELRLAGMIERAGLVRTTPHRKRAWLYRIPKIHHLYCIRCGKYITSNEIENDEIEPICKDTWVHSSCERDWNDPKTTYRPVEDPRD